EYKDAHIGNGFVASHVWRRLANNESASRHPITYSFIPNLVWLPTQVAKLSDREGSFVQTYLQAISKKIYFTVPVSPYQQNIVTDAWGLLTHPSGIPQQGLPRVEDLNFFAPSGDFIRNRLRSLRKVANLIASIVSGQAGGPQVSKRYNEGLRLMKREQ